MADGGSRGGAAGDLVCAAATPAHPMHHYDPTAGHRLFVLNVFSIAVIVLLFGWLQAGIYRRMETRVQDDLHPYATGTSAAGSAMGSSEPSRKI